MGGGDAGGGGGGGSDGDVAGVCWGLGDRFRAKRTRCINVRCAPRYIVIDRSRYATPFLTIVPISVILSIDYLGARIVIEILISRDCRRAGYS